MSTSRFHLQGWFVTYTNGIPTIYFALTDEALITQPVDTPANTSFRPRILNAQNISFKKVAHFWPLDDTDFELMIVSDIEIDNYDGKYNFLLRADLKGAKSVFQLPKAGMLAAPNTVSTTPVIGTAIFDGAESSDEQIITASFKDPLAELDTTLAVQYNQPWVSGSAANQMRPLSFGAFRNRKAQLVDEENDLYRLHDAALGNIQTVKDIGYPLDPNALPPDFTAAFNRGGIQLARPPAGMVLVDGSSVGTQVTVPGITDVLAGVGTLDVTHGLTTWPVAGSPPTGWTYGNPSAGTYSRLAATNGYDQDYVMQMVTHHVYNPSISEFGLNANVTAPFLQPGQHYRIRMMLDRMYRPGTDGTGGFLVRTDLTRAASGDVSGSAFGPYLTQPSGDANYIFEYECPADGTVRSLYMIMVGAGATFPDFTGAWHGLTVELLGQFQDAPLRGSTFNDHFYEVLYNRAYKAMGTWNASDLVAIDVATIPPGKSIGYEFGVCFDTPPNILKDMLLPPLKCVAGTLFSDKNGVWRACRLADPRSLAKSVRFDLTDTKRPISIRRCTADFLTTKQGFRRNWQISGTSDLSSDTNQVTADDRVRWGRTSQEDFTSSKSLAAAYQHAAAAPIFDTLGEDRDAVEFECDRVVSIFGPNTYSDGTFVSGNRVYVDIPVLFDDIETLGAGTTIAAEDLLLGMGGVFNYPERGFVEEPFQIHGIELFPCNGEVIVTVMI